MLDASCFVVYIFIYVIFIFQGLLALEQWWVFGWVVVMSMSEVIVF